MQRKALRTRRGFSSNMILISMFFIFINAMYRQSKLLPLLSETTNVLDLIESLSQISDRYSHESIVDGIASKFDNEKISKDLVNKQITSETKIDPYLEHHRTFPTTEKQQIITKNTSDRIEMSCLTMTTDQQKEQALETTFQPSTTLVHGKKCTEIFPALIETNNVLLREYASSELNKEYFPFCVLIEYIFPRQDPATSNILFESHHDQYALSSNHKIDRLGNNVVLTAAEQKECTSATLKFVITQLEEWNIPCMIYFGTLLGAYRHHDFIPWDDDADIIISSKHASDLRRRLFNIAKEQVEEQNPTRKSILHTTADVQSYQWIVRNGQDSNTIPIKIANIHTGRYVDIFSMHPDNEWKTLSFGNQKIIRPMFGRYDTNDVVPSQPCVLGNEIYKCPNNPYAVLKSMYGSIGVASQNRKQMVGMTEYDGIVSSLQITNTTKNTVNNVLILDDVYL